MRRRGGEVLVDRRDGGLRHEDREGDAARPPPPGPRGGGVPQDGPGERDRLPERSVVRAHRLKITRDRKSTRLNSSHLVISYAVFCLKKKKNAPPPPRDNSEVGT